MIRLACPHCKSVQQFSPDCGGKTIACPKCRKPIGVPPGVPAPAVAVPAQPASMGSGYTVPASPMQAPEFVAPPETRMNPLLLVGGGLAVVLFGILLLVSLFSSGSKDEKRETADSGPTSKRRPTKDTSEMRPVGDVVADLKNEDDTLRLQAVREIERRGIGGKEALTMLQGIFKDSTRNDNVHLQTRRSAAIAIGKLGSGEDEAARQNLAALLQTVYTEPDQGLRYAALDGLGMLGKQGVPPLVQAFNLFASDKKFAMRAGDVLATMGNNASESIGAMQAIMANAEIHDKVRIASFIVRIDPRGPGVVPVLNQALKYNDEGVRKHAVVVITEMGPAARGTTNNLTFVAEQDINAEIRDLAQKALAKMMQ